MGIPRDVPPAELARLLTRMQLSANVADGGATLIVEVPPTRPDVLHECDIWEDAAISYGFNTIKWTQPKVPHTHSLSLSLSLALSLSLSLYVYLSISIYLSIYLSLSLSIYLYLYLPIYLSIYVSLFLFHSLSLFVCMCVSFLLPASLCAYLLVCFSIVIREKYGANLFAFRLPGGHQRPTAAYQ